ncbi:MAG: hypothetical protein IIZ40_01070 [Bacilli bacterium]|nr:hypothetical protein [Bacilli bacterium]
MRNIKKKELYAKVEDVSDKVVVGSGLCFTAGLIALAPFVAVPSVAVGATSFAVGRYASKKKRKILSLENNVDLQKEM